MAWVVQSITIVEYDELLGIKLDGVKEEVGWNTLTLILVWIHITRGTCHVEVEYTLIFFLLLLGFRFGLVEDAVLGFFLLSLRDLKSVKYSL